MPSAIEELNSTMSSLAARVGQSVVQVGDGSGGGAGSIWHSGGLVVTNAHVARRKSLRVTLADGRLMRARLLARDTFHDVAALGIDMSGLPAIELGDSRRLQPGQWVFALGHPHGVRHALTGGVVIGTGPNWDEGPLAGREWLMLDLHLRPGNSGGPVFDVQGRMIGISTAIDGPESGLAVPVHTVKAFLREALQSEKVA
ncbi:MAG: hypothetical protein FJ317_00430 [SAR202 cluster bacterium]|nr:hypothetical protein [SAR202 cluster bacterium]